MGNLMPLLAFCILYSFSFIPAQDIIVKKNGEIVPAKVEKIMPNHVEYHKESNPEGPLYVIDRCEIKEIRYKNGTFDQFTEKCGKERLLRGNHHKMPKYFLSLEGRAGIFGLFNVNNSETVFAKHSFGGTPSFMMRVSRFASMGLECMFLWGQPDTTDPARFILDPNIRTELHFPLTPEITLGLITAGGLSIWPIHDVPGKLHETFFDQRTGWDVRVAFGMDYRLNKTWSLLANAGYSANSSVSKNIWITHDMMTIDIGVRYHVGKIMFDKNE